MLDMFPSYRLTYGWTSNSIFTDLAKIDQFQD